ncbi:hypothetical protein HY251_11525 [bacterium]|nr:hypothetical protein [bacterium]
MEAFRHACRIFILAQEIIVDYASYPTKAIAQNSHDYRPLGLGYANLGTLLMVEGVPYDSPRGLATCGAITAIMTGAAYEASAEIAASKGPFPGFAHNRDPMLRVMNQRRDAAYAIGQDASPELLSAAREAWDRALAAGERWGYRNAQATVLAPTGTIGLLMDCDTTGIEPDFALVKFKKLAGGGYFKIVNQSVQPALRNLGYTESEVSEIVDYLRGTLSFEHAPHVNRASLLAKGLLEAEITRAEAALPSVFQLRHAFSRFVLGDAALARLGFAGECEKPSFDLLEALGFTPAQIEEATEVICGRLTIEGAPHLKTEHLPVFDCANRCGKRGKRFIAPLGHVRMMAAAQPFVSGAISKTVNLPKETSVEEVEKIYVEAWRLGLKAIALYRDGSKASQVLSSAGGGGGDESRPTQSESKSSESSSPSHSPAATAGSPATKAAKPAEAAPVAPVAQAASPETASAAPPRLARRRLPKKRAGFTQEARVGGQKIYIRTGEYEDGSLGEIFIDMHKEGAAFRSLVNCFAISISLGLQHGVPLEEFVDAFTFTRFEPHGPVDHPNIKSATSVIDFIFRMLGMEYLGRTDFVHVKPADSVEGLDEEEATPPAPEAPAPVQLAPVANAVVAQHSPTANAVAPGEAASQRRSPVADAPAQAADSARPRETRSVVTETQSTIVAVKHASGTNGNGAHAPSNGSQVTAPTGGFASGSLVVRTETRRIQKVRSALSEHASNMMGDAPACSECGHITIRNGTCYRCVNCGHSMGCS